MSSGQRLTLITGVMLSASLKHYSTAVIVRLALPPRAVRISRFAPLSEPGLQRVRLESDPFSVVHHMPATRCQRERGISPCRVSSKPSITHV